MARDTPLGFPAHTLPYRRGEFTTLSTVSKSESAYADSDLDVSNYYFPAFSHEPQANIFLQRLSTLKYHCIHPPIFHDNLLK